MKKSIIPVAAFIAGMAIVPSVFAATTDPMELTSFGDVKDVTSKDTLYNVNTDGATVTLSNENNNEKVTVKYSGDLNLNYVAKDEDKGRDISAAWLGIQVAAPGTADDWADTATDNKLYEGNVHIKVDGTVLNKKFSDVKDSTNKPGYINLYAPITSELLTEKATAGISEFVLRTWEFDWNGDNEYDQTVEMVIDTTKINLWVFEKDEDGEDKETLNPVPAFTTEKAAALIAAAPETPADDNTADDKTDDGETNPNTADSIATYLTIATVALLGLGATAFVAKKSNR